METNGNARFSLAPSSKLVASKRAIYKPGGSVLGPAPQRLARPSESVPLDPASPPLPAALQGLAAEIATYFRELPQLLADGQHGRVALIQGARVVSVWDTFGDACQAGQEHFGLDAFIAQPIDPRDLVPPSPRNLRPE